MDTKRIVIPGELLSGNPSLSGPGTYVSGGKVYASVCGLLAQKGKFSVHPLSGPYLPKKNDIIIGYTTVVTSSNWIFDINCPYEGLLHVMEYPIRVPSEEMTQHFNIGDTVLLKVTDVNSEMKIELTYKDSLCRKLTKGRLHEVPYSKVSRIIGRSGAMISMLKAKTGCEIFVGGNGRIWMNGDSEDMDILTSALKKIEADARVPGLTDLTAAYIDEQYTLIGSDGHGKKNATDSESDSKPSLKAKTGPVSKQKSAPAAPEETPEIMYSGAELESLPRKKRSAKKTADDGKTPENAPAAGKSAAAENPAENPAAGSDGLSSKSGEEPAKKPRPAQPKACRQESCTCFGSVFFTHPPVPDGHKSDG
ncbi:MAG: exosome complex RNA-binding protein Rrp4 [Methanimicrococcus sp.]|nr:exosome complex RNA-binding protein Rrp4 [Methanimicrococcus sp.]